MRSATTPRVLVVEDSEAIREMVLEALAEAGYVSGGRREGSGREDGPGSPRPPARPASEYRPGLVTACHYGLRRQ